jgi:hypothetical protein
MKTVLLLAVLYVAFGIACDTFHLPRHGIFMMGWIAGNLAGVVSRGFWS